MSAIATNITVVWSVRLSHFYTLQKQLDGMRMKFYWTEALVWPQKYYVRQVLFPREKKSEG